MAVLPYKPWQLSWWSCSWAEATASEKNKFRWLLLIHFLLCFLFVRSQGILFDEPGYFTYAVLWAKGHPFRAFPIMDSKSPMMAVSLIPAIFKPLFPYDILQKDIFFFLKLGRYWMYLYQALGLFVMFCWLRRFDNRYWLLPLLLYAFDPLIFSYSMFIGSDLSSASLLVATIYTAWRFVQTRKNKYWLYCSLLLALAVVSKASMLYCYPLLVLLLCISRKQWKLPVSKYLSLLLVFLFIQLFVINAAWYFTGTFILFGNYPFESATLQALQASSTILKRIPMLLPAPFVQGIDMLKHHAEIGGCKPESTYGGVWLFDRVWCNQPVWYYYLATSLFKFPLFTWALSIGSVVLFLMQSARGSLIRKYMFVWVPFLFFLLILSFFNKFQIGIRHALVLLPFLYLLLSSSIIYFSRNYKLVFFTLLIFHTISVLNYLPNLIAYTNELIRDKKNAYHIIRDSSLDYGQGKPWIRKFIEAHPGYKTPGNLPDTGKFVISVADLFAEHNGEKNNIAWLRNHFNASGHYRYSLLLFNVSATGLREKGLCPRYK